MKILITSLLLFTGLNQALARSLPWLNHNLEIDYAWMDDDYDIFRLPSNQPSDDFYKFMLGDDSVEATKAWERPAEKSSQGGFFGTLLGSFLNMDEEDTNTSENIPNNSDEKKPNDDDGDDGDSGDTGKKLNTFLDAIFGPDEEQSSQENTNFVENENDSSVESKLLKRENDKSNEDSDDVASVLEVDIFDLTRSSEEKQDNNESEARSLENSNEATEITDMTKSSQEQNSVEDDNLSETDINKLASFFIALNILSDVGAVIQSPESKDEIARGKEADEILEIFGSVLDKMIEQEVLSKHIDSNEKTITIKNVSVEEDESDESTENTTTTTTTPKTDSNESSDDDDNTSNSSEDNTNNVYVVFKGIDEKGDQQSLSQHKYSVIDSQQAFKPTSAPYMPENDDASFPSTGAQSTINEYVEIRENLDTQQDSLKKHEMDLDRDFYAIVSNNFDGNTLDKFEKDIYAAQENLDKIKKNINAMQNLQTKLYFHKLVTTAVKEANSKPAAL